MSDEMEDAGRDTGPFCRHYGDPTDCELDCECGHKCGMHWMGEDTPCQESDCECKEYAQKCDHGTSDSGVLFQAGKP